MEEKKVYALSYADDVALMAEKGDEKHDREVRRVPG